MDYGLAVCVISLMVLIRVILYCGDIDAEHTQDSYEGAE